MGLGDTLPSGTREVGKDGREARRLRPDWLVHGLSEPQHFLPHVAVQTRSRARSPRGVRPGLGLLDTGSAEAGVCSGHSTTGDSPRVP